MHRGVENSSRKSDLVGRRSGEVLGLVDVLFKVADDESQQLLTTQQMLEGERTLKTSSPFQRTSPSGLSVAQALEKGNSETLGQFDLRTAAAAAKGGGINALVLRLVTSAPEHSVDRSTPTKHLSSGPVFGRSSCVRLGDSLVLPIVGGLSKGQKQRGPASITFCARRRAN